MHEQEMYSLLPNERDRFVFVELLKTIYRGQCLPFIGSGVSKEADVGIPDVKQLTTLLMQECINVDSAATTRLKDKPLQAVAQDYILVHERLGIAFPRRRLADFLKQHLTYDDASVLPGKSSFPFIVNIPWQKDSKCIIITTNWDTLIEDAVGKHTGNKQFKIISKKEQITNLGNHNAVKVVKLHGTLDDENSIIITENDYTEAMAGKREQALFHWFGTQIMTQTVVFVGYSLSDANIKLLYENMKNNAGQKKFDHYIVNGEHPDPSDVKWWDEQGVKFLPLNARDFFRLVYIETNRFINRDEQRALEKVSSNRYLAIIGKAGLGKTTLLQRIEDDLKYLGSTSRFSFFHYESYGHKTSSPPWLDFLAFLENFAKKVGVILPPIPPAALLEDAKIRPHLQAAILTVRQAIRRPGLLLFDCATELDPTFGHYLAELIKDENQNGHLYSVVASRAEINWPEVTMRRLFKKNRDMLVPFDEKHAIPEWIKFQFLYCADTFLRDHEARQIAIQIQKLTYGHPGAIKLVMEELTQDPQNCQNALTALAFLKSRRLDLIDKIHREVIVGQIFQSLDAQAQELLADSFCVLREHNPNIFAVLRPAMIQSDLLTHLQKLIEHNLVSKTVPQHKRRGYFYTMDFIVRGILSTRLKSREPDRYRELNRQVGEFYRDHGAKWTDDLQRTALLEWLWHRLCCIELETSNFQQHYDTLYGEFKTAATNLESSGGPDFIGDLRAELFQALDDDDEVEDKFLEIFGATHFFDNFLGFVKTL